MDTDPDQMATWTEPTSLSPTLPLAHDVGQLTALKDEVLKAIGRNVLTFQQIEGFLKYLVANSSMAAPHSEFRNVQNARAEKPSGMTLGQLVGSVTGNYVGWLVFRASAVNGTSGDAAVYNNEALISDTGSQLWGVYLQNLTGTLNVCHYNWDSAARVAKSSFSASAWNVVQVRRTGGNIYLKVNSTAETAGVAVGSVAVSGTLSVMRGGSTTYMDGQVAFIGFATGGNIASDTGAGGRLERMRKALGARFGVTVT